MQKQERNVDLHTFNILSICSGVGGLTAETIRQIDENNVVYDSLCDE